VSGALKAVPGVKTVEVNLRAGTAAVVHDANANPADLVKAVNGLSHLGQRGVFQATVLSTGAPSGKQTSKSGKATALQVDLERQIVFVVQGLSNPVAEARGFPSRDGA
jgi:copper chaperone CopZ